MARPLLMERTGVWYHGTGRGIERRNIFTDASDRRHWLELLAEVAGMFGLQAHAYVRAHVEAAVRQGVEESPWERLTGRLVLGGRELLEELRQGASGRRREQPYTRLAHGSVRPSLRSSISIDFIPGAQAPAWNSLPCQQRRESAGKVAV